MERQEVSKSLKAAAITKIQELLAENQHLKEYLAYLKKENENLRGRINQIESFIEELSPIMVVEDHPGSNII